MATVTLSKKPLWMQNSVYPASLDRTLIDVLFATEGVLSGFAVTAGGGLNISVSAGQAVIAGDEVAGQGKYLVDSDSAIDLLLAAVGVARAEYVYLLVNDPAVAGGRAGNNVTIETGTSIPANSSLLLATLVLPGGTATITSDMITDNRVIIGTAILDGSVTTGKLANGSVTAAKIADNTIGIGQIGTAAVGTDELVNGAVTTAKIVDLAVTSAKIALQAVNTDQLAIGSVSGNRIGDGQVTEAKLQNSSVTAIKIAQQAVGSAQIADGSIVAGDLNASVLNEGWTAVVGATATYWTSPSGYYKKLGNMVFFHFQGSFVTQNTQTIGFTFPVGFRPLGDWWGVAGNLSTDTVKGIVVQAGTGNLIWESVTVLADTGKLWAIDLVFPAA